MANMSYCRFQNTVRDLRDCYCNIGNGDLSKDEAEARKTLLEMCAHILETWGYEDDDGNLNVAEHSPAEMRELFACDFDGYEEDDDGG